MVRVGVALDRPKSLMFAMLTLMFVLMFVLTFVLMFKSIMFLFAMFPHQPESADTRHLLNCLCGDRAPQCKFS